MWQRFCRTHQRCGEKGRHRTAQCATGVRPAIDRCSIQTNGGTVHENKNGSEHHEGPNHPHKLSKAQDDVSPNTILRISTEPVDRVKVVGDAVDQKAQQENLQEAKLLDQRMEESQVTQNWTQTT